MFESFDIFMLMPDIYSVVVTSLNKLVLPSHHKLKQHLWFCGVVVITTAQLHLTKPELRFCTG